jgi:nucleoside-diphosphate-sugar epimerase
MKVFIVGASGYIGGSIATSLLAAGHEVAGLVRSDERAAAVRARGIEPVRGTLADVDVLAREARRAGAVIHAANADDRASVEAILAALRGTGKRFIHTSGSGIVADRAGGNATDRVYDEDTPVTPLPERAARAALNAAIRAAAAEGIVPVVIAPPMIYGLGTGVHADSIQIPKLIAVARKRGEACCVGPGANAWSNVHVEDLADCYRLALERAPAGAFYYAENGENTLRELGEAIARAQGLDGRTRSLSIDEAYAEFGQAATDLSFGSNSRVRALRARRELGWAPSRASLLHEIERGCYASARPAGP